MPLESRKKKAKKSKEIHGTYVRREIWFLAAQPYTYLSRTYVWFSARCMYAEMWFLVAQHYTYLSITYV